MHGVYYFGECFICGIVIDVYRRKVLPWYMVQMSWNSSSCRLITGIRRKPLQGYIYWDEGCSRRTLKKAVMAMSLHMRSCRFTESRWGLNLQLRVHSLMKLKPSQEETFWGLFKVCSDKVFPETVFEILLNEKKLPSPNSAILRANISYIEPWRGY